MECSLTAQLVILGAVTSLLLLTIFVYVLVVKRKKKVERHYSSTEIK